MNHRGTEIEIAVEGRLRMEMDRKKGIERDEERKDVETEKRE